MRVERPCYLNQLIRKKDNGRIKVITGVRRSGKSFLLFDLYRDYLNQIGIPDSQIIELTLDEISNARYRNPNELDQFIRKAVCDTSLRYYVFIDEIQFVSEIENPYLPGDKIGFADTLLGLMKLPNADLYVTGSNSRLLSSEIVTQFRDRADEIRVFPLSFREFSSVFPGDKHIALREYFTYGGLPHLLQLDDHRDKTDYLKGLFDRTYIADVLERHDLRNEKSVLDDLLNELASSVGSLTNPSVLSNTFRSVRKISVSSTTLSRYIDYLEEAFILEKAFRYDVKGRKYIGTPLKYYFVDVGLRNARLEFRQQEENHIMENVLYNDLLNRGFSVDVGIIEERKKDERTWLEVDFVAKDGSRTIYVQSSLHIDQEETRTREIRSLIRIPDSFQKIVVVKDDIIPWHDEHGILYIGIMDFLLSDNLNAL